MLNPGFSVVHWAVVLTVPNGTNIRRSTTNCPRPETSQAMTVVWYKMS